MSKALLVLTSLVLFFAALEGSSVLYLKYRKPEFRNLSPRLSEEIWNFSDVEKHSASLSREGEIARVIRNGKFQERLGVYKFTPDDIALKLEAPEFPPSDKGHNLHSALFTVTPGLNDTFSVFGAHSGKLKYRVQYTTDDTGMRKGFQGKTGNILFIGCSYTFGQGLNDEETFPYVVGKKTGYRTFNKGIPGTGPLTILKNLKDQKEKYFRNIPEDETTVVLTIIPEQFPRVFNTISYLQNIEKIADHPYLVSEGNQLIVKTRNESDLNPDYYLSRLSFPFALGIEFPVYGEKEYRLFARVLNEIQIELKKNSPHVKNFAVALFPTGSARNLYKELRNVLVQEKNLVVFDYTPLHGPSLFGHTFHLKYDGHPSPMANELFSDLLIYDLRKSFGI